MKIDLKNYLDERDKQRDLIMVPGPFITISRQYGCEAHKLASHLMYKLGGFVPGPLKRTQWQYLSKEIINDSAKSLKLPSWDLERRMHAIPSGDVEAFFASFRPYYSITDRAIIDKIREIIRFYAAKGNSIIIGLGGATLTKDVPNGLRIRLIAPADWRAKAIAAKTKATVEEARNMIEHFDAERIKMAQTISGRDFDDSYYDLILNVKNLSLDEITNTIIQIMQDRKMITGDLMKVEEEKLMFH